MAKFNNNSKERSKTAVLATTTAGKSPFVFGELTTLVSSQVRDNESAGAGNDTEWEFSETNAEKIRTENFNNCYELLDSREQLIAEIKTALAETPNKGPKTREQLCLIFDTMLELRSQSHEKVKQVEVRKKLGIARSTFSDYVKVLDSVIEPIRQKYLSV